MESGLIAADFVAQALSGRLPAHHGSSDLRRGVSRVGSSAGIARIRSRSRAPAAVAGELPGPARQCRPFRARAARRLIDEQGDARDLFSFRGLLMSLVR
jgi:hypothetical protein